MNLTGTFLLVFPVRNVRGNQDKEDRPILILSSPSHGEGPAAFAKAPVFAFAAAGKPADKSAATTLVSAVQALVTGTAAHHDMSAHVTGRRVALHTFRSGAE